MAKRILIIEDRAAHIEELYEVAGRAREGGAIDKADEVYLVGAHKDADKAHRKISTLPLYTPCRKFEELQKFILSIQGDRLLLLDLDLEGVHGRGAKALDREKTLKFYSQLVKSKNSRTCILLYSSSLQTREKYKRFESLIKESGDNSGCLGWIDKNPVEAGHAEEILNSGLDLYFSRPLQTPALRMELNAFHAGKLSERDFIDYFNSINSSDQFPAGALEWLMSDWLRKVYYK